MSCRNSMISRYRLIKIVNRVVVGFVTTVLQFGYNLVTRLCFIYFVGMSVGVSHSKERR